MNRSSKKAVTGARGVRKLTHASAVKGRASAVKGRASTVKGASAVKGRASTVKGTSAVKGRASTVKGRASTVKGRKAALPTTEETKEEPPTPQDISAQTIQRAWISHMNKTIFQLLKHTIRAAECCVPYEILKNVSPAEAQLMKDPSMKCKVRFRFSGEKFPPFIVFKIFHQTRGHGYKYFSGKTVLNPSIKGSTDAYKMMGRKKFHEQLVEDERLSQKFKITDEIDIVTLQDYMQYSSLLDETPASFGGRNNCWRRLSLKNIPRAMMIYDIVHYAESKVISDRLQKKMSYLLQKPRTEEMRQDQLRTVSEVRSKRPVRRPHQQQSQIKHLDHQSKQAQMKAEKMKKAEKEKNVISGASVVTEPQKDIPDKKRETILVFTCSKFDLLKYREISPDEKLEKRKKKLFSWCHDVYIHRFPPF
ncbi:uncharacterized protein CXorf58 homolog [Saccopteryx leptura]|uniref:uncharacterized protein CXorf58 homolog n=1 Tax=Saccopteryx leptura TaxID=249018 RepID=UPI00339CC1EA